MVAWTRALPLLLILLVLVPAAQADISGPLVATVTGPSGLGPAQNAYYNLTLSGVPSGLVNYTVTYYITAANLSGAAPLQTSPGKLTGNQTSYRLNVTSPATEEALTLSVAVVAEPASGGSENTTTTFAITVTRPVVLTASFHNDGATAAVNVTVRWYVDGAYVGTSLIRQIAANGDATATFNYIPTSLSAGEHTVTATATIGSHTQTATSTIFYNQVQPVSTGWAVLLGIAVFLPVLIAVVALRRRGQT